MPKLVPFAYEPIEVPPIENATADQILLVTDVRFLEARIIQRRLAAAPAVRPLLQGAVQVAAAGDPVRAREALVKAVDAFQTDVQTKNRLIYLVGTLLGTVILAFVTATVLALAQLPVFGGGDTLASPPTIIPLFVFAGLGSTASVLSRLETINLREEMRRQWVLVSAGTRPLLAVAYASVAYVILSRGLVTFSGFDTNAVIWVAAFLCGFSERFGVDLLASLPFMKPEKVEAAPRTDAGAKGDAGPA